MWLTKKLQAEKVPKLSSGQVEDGGGFSIMAESRYERPEQIFPYGFISATPKGREVLMLDGYCAGIVSAPEGELEEGEMRLYSEGGAEIKLLNNGTVEINGQIFERKEG